MKTNKRQSPFNKQKMPLSELLIKISIAFFCAVVFFVCFFSFGGVNFLSDIKYCDNFKNYEFQIHTIDVENGDAFLLKLPQKKTMLIDCGDEQYSDRVVSYIKQYMKNERVNSIDYFVMTHSDSDHVGGAVKVFNEFNVKSVYRPKIYSKNESQYSLLSENYKTDKTSTYDNALQAAYSEGCKMNFNEEGLKINLPNCEINFLSPSLDNYDEDNDYSAVIMIEYYSLKTLFMGDASTQIEKRLIDVYGDQLDCDILKVGHHGSKTSTSQELLSYTSPQLAVLSCSDSSTFFPNSQVVENLNQYNCKILSSAKQGNFVISYANNEIVFGKRDAQFNYWTIIFSVVLMALFILWKVPFTDKNSILNNIKR